MPPSHACRIVQIAAVNPKSIRYAYEYAQGNAEGMLFQVALDDQEL